MVADPAFEVDCVKKKGVGELVTATVEVNKTDWDREAVDVVVWDWESENGEEGELARLTDTLGVSLIDVDEVMVLQRDASLVVVPVTKAFVGDTEVVKE